jgi:hypothetical protein
MGSEGLQQRQRFANTERKGFYRDCQHSGDVSHVVFSHPVVRSLQPNTIAIAELPRISLPNLASGKYAWRIYSKEERVLLPKHGSWSLVMILVMILSPTSASALFSFKTLVYRIGVKTVISGQLMTSCQRRTLGHKYADDKGCSLV